MVASLEKKYKIKKLANDIRNMREKIRTYTEMMDANLNDAENALEPLKTVK